ncbi:DUF1800 domain-containing protein [Erythrobacter sp.]|uniref:DUF1800 domain-containing protein n=1 Tax=Erythrobacter sp. TaxID=1042 RepID=UPI001425CAA5|nr:DUF1800 domain-containing protein [Erythrobacter sp.]QIQ85262.1 MAG: DUF1800 domain-containing protein [Erythrobacter sp.]QIQ88012.1 MAG: DUF1800 domain-containing protein [Erythrobacter sp.]
MSDTLEQPEERIAAESGPAGSPEPSSNTQDEPAKPAGIAAPGTAALALGLATAACGGGGSGSPGGSASAGGGGGAAPPTVLKPQTDEEAARFALHAGLSVSPGDVLELRSEGYEAWLDREINQSIEQTAEQFLSGLGFEDVDDNQWFFRSDPADYMIWSQLLSGRNSVRKRIALALSEFFVVSVNNITIWPSSAIGAYWDILKSHAFGNFRDLIEAITLNAAMGVFLNTLGNQKADPTTGRVPDENYAREVMQLFSIGLFELNADGTVRTDGAGEPIETYTNDDVTGIAKVFTGYNYDYSGDIKFASPPSQPDLDVPEARLLRAPMTADPARRFPFGRDTHSLEEKRFLGTTIPAGTGAPESLRIAMDTLFNHPNVGPFFGRQMIQRLVTSNPSPDYVRRVAQAFDDNGSGVRGDLRAVFKAVLLDDEALSPASLTSTTFGKLREPMLRFAQWGRTFGARSDTGAWLMQNLSQSANRLGQSPLRSPSVFNFFRPGYTPANSQAAAADLVAPEFQIVNETTAASYINFMERTIDGRGGWMFDVRATYAQELDIVHDIDALLDRLDLLLTAGQLSQSTRTTIADALGATPVSPASSEAAKLAQIHRAVLLVMVSNDYLVQK